MKTMNPDAYRHMVKGAHAINPNKVLKLSDGRISKIFRRKRLISSTVLWPYANRFARGAKRLEGLGIPTVEITDLFRVKALKVDVVVYQPIPGRMLREVLTDPETDPNLLGRFAVFLAQLHEKGVYFRSIHLGNVIVLENGKDFGLIDLSGTYFQRRPLSLNKRVRNFNPVLKAAEDRASIMDFGIKKFMGIYLSHAGLGDRRGKTLSRRIAKRYNVY